MKITCAITALAVLAVSPAFADCVAPAAPAAIPDGNTATMNDMLAANKAVVDFNSATNTYLACVDKQHDDAIKAAGSDISTEQRDKLDKAQTTAHNAAVDKLNRVAGQFNEQVRAFKAKAAAAQQQQKANAKGKNGKG